jgi:hypothetical protein
MAAITHVEPLPRQDLTLLFDKVRNNLADVPEEMLKTATIYDSLKQSNLMCSQLIQYGTDLEYQKQCMVALATMFAYQSYTALAARKLGNVPETAAITLSKYQSIARALIHPVADTPLRPDLTQDDAWLSKLKISAIGKTSGTLNLPLPVSPTARY